MSRITPMLKQYLGIKSEYPDAILFFRMGDFYEMFFEDARIASKILGITLTSRGTHNGEKIPMCGIPYHSYRSYVAKLIENGWKVAICEQVEDPRAGKGIVKREVVRVATPGSVIDEGEVDGKSNIYMAAVSGNPKEYGLAHVDLSTGEFRVTELREWGEVLDELSRIGPAEVLIPQKNADLAARGLNTYRLEVLEKEDLDKSRAETLLKELLGVRSLAGFGCDQMNEGIVAAGTLVEYLQDTQKGNPDHIREITSYRIGNYMFLDETTTTNLELFRTIRRHSVKGSLFQVLDRTVTPMGGRLLRRWIGYPLVDVARIKERLAAVANFRDDRIFREDIVRELEGIGDMERLTGRISLGRAGPRDLAALRSSILRLPAIRERLSHATSILLSDISLDPLEDICRWIGNAVVDDPPVSLKEGGCIREGYSPELDELIGITRDGKKWISRLAADEQKRTGIPSLKIGYNRVFGYYIEITRANLHLVPKDYIRKQTLANGERYITERLKEYEEKVLGAEERRISLETEIFEEIRARVALESRRIKKTAEGIARIDVLAGLASVAETNHFTCPEVNEGGTVDIVDGRHPVVEQTVKDEEFVPNDIHLDEQDHQLLIITGPNMAGKSTILRQTALTVLMAQIGSFIPASKGVIGIVDRIFTRIGASDDLARGRSTFMVEMNETANILRHVTPKSLVILDEIGRGTSTYDGLSIAWAVAEALHDKDRKGVRTLFATHYHELTRITAAKCRARNYNIAVREWNDQIIFLRKLVPGATSRSYGIQVAKIAGIPEEVIERSKEILADLEKEEALGHVPEDATQLSLFDSKDRKLQTWIENLDIPAMSPLEALIELDKLKRYFTEGP